MEVVKWARENGCPWDHKTSTYMPSAQGGHLEILKWAREHWCPWDAWENMRRPRCSPVWPPGADLGVLKI
jgi:hypothetical protein